MKKIKKLKSEIIVFLITLFFTGFNLFGYPEAWGDEGVYAGQAWWLVHFGKIAPYTYWYDHFPLGWFQIGIWQLLTGGPFRFGMAIFSARMFIVLLVSLTNVFLFKIVKKLTKRKVIGFFASFLFAASPIAIFYHRQALLDNIATFWLILAFWFLLKTKGDLWHYFLSGLFLGIGFLSKESTLFFLPGFLFGLLVTTKKANRSFCFLLFLTTFFTLISLLPLLALLKNEFFPPGWFSSQAHVSLLETLQYQMGRGNKIPFWQEGSEIRIVLSQWLKRDALLCLFGLWSTILLAFSGKKDWRFSSSLAISYGLFLIRGGLVLDFYLIPLIPFLAINTTLLVDFVLRKFSQSKLFIRTALVSLILLLTAFYLSRWHDFFFLDATANQRQLIKYAKDNLSPEAVIVSDFTPWMDLRLTQPNYTNIEWFYKVELDPEIRYGKLDNDYKNVDYLILTNEILAQVEMAEFPFIEEILDNSSLVYELTPIIRENHIYENSWIKIYKIKKEEVTFAQIMEK
ncbi:glycosyltransferase family 39 protein [Candidatus Microgenomates bacterium]|nr:glycosyltransferase family 39 protein [Candidatus Microgenomates bacterium]